MRALPRLWLAKLAAQRAAQESVARTFSAEALCFGPQLAFVRDRARYKVACCSRRAGKTVACAIMLLASALAHPDSENLYITLARVSGKRIVWKRLLRFNQEYNLGGRIDRTELTITFPNGATIYVAGGKDESEIEKWRGPAYQMVVIDEAQAFRDHIRELVDDICAPAIIETKGTIVMIGTPAKTKAGFFYEACLWAAPGLRKQLALDTANDNAALDNDVEGDDTSSSPLADAEWSVHHWTIQDNPWIPDVIDELAAIRRRKRWTEDAPTYQREYLGRWVVEHASLVYKYDPVRNSYDPARLPAGFFDGPEWKFVVFVDQGYEHADAVGALGWKPALEPWIWLLPGEHVERKANSSKLGSVVAEFWERYKGRCVGVIWDEGGGGKKVAADVRDNRAIPVEAAKKPDKVAGIEAINADLETGVLKIPINSQAAADAARVTWDPKHRGVKISGKYHTDIWDGIVYGRQKIAPRAIPEITAWEEAQRKAISATSEEREAVEREARIKARVLAFAAQEKKLQRAGRGLFRRVG